MKEALRDPGRLEHILKAIDYALCISEGKDKNTVSELDPIYFALVKNIEIIGEASFMITNEFKEKHPNTPWKSIVGMRHVLVHGYYEITKDDLWNVVRNDLPPLREQVEGYLKEFETTEALPEGS